jgi:ATPase involved in DNA replication initiation
MFGSSLELASDPIDTSCTFTSWIPHDKSPTLALKLLQEEALKPKGSPIDFNPIFIWGPPGCGKSHLLMATASALRSHGLNVLYVKAETFTDHLVRAIRRAEMAAFRAYYRSTDILIVDDIHLFSKKTTTQEEFFIHLIRST